MTRPIPDGWHSVTPRLVAHDAASLVEFLKQAFGGTGDFRADIPSEIRIGDSIVPTISNWMVRANAMIISSAAPRRTS